MRKRNVSTILFYDQQGRVLLQDRTGISKSGEEWGFFGGGIEEGETPDEAIRREIREELGYDLEDYEFFRKFVGVFNQNTEVTAHIHLARFPGYNKFNQKEGDGMELFSIEEAMKLKLVPIDYEILPEVGEYLKSKS